MISKLVNASVKLENPDFTVHVIFTESQSFLGVSTPEIKEKRPVKIHNHPHQLDWKLTRAMINLIGLEQGQNNLRSVLWNGNYTFGGRIYGYAWNWH